MLYPYRSKNFIRIRNITAPIINFCHKTVYFVIKLYRLIESHISVSVLHHAQRITKLDSERIEAQQTV